MDKCSDFFFMYKIYFLLLSVSYLAVLAVHVGVVDAKLLPGLPHLEPLPQSHEYGANTCGPHKEYILQIILLFKYVNFACFFKTVICHF